MDNFGWLLLLANEQWKLQNGRIKAGIYDLPPGILIKFNQSCSWNAFLSALPLELALASAKWSSSSWALISGMPAKCPGMLALAWSWGLGAWGMESQEWGEWEFRESGVDNNRIRCSSALNKRHFIIFSLCCLPAPFRSLRSCSSCFQLLSVVRGPSPIVLRSASCVRHPASVTHFSVRFCSLFLLPPYFSPLPFFFVLSLLSFQLQSGAHFTLIARWRNRSTGHGHGSGSGFLFPLSFFSPLCSSVCVCNWASISLGLLLLPFAIILVSRRTGKCTVLSALTSFA